MGDIAMALQPLTRPCPRTRFAAHPFANHRLNILRSTEPVGPAARQEGVVVTHGERRPTIGDVAAAAGVSKTSVSFAYNAPER